MVEVKVPDIGDFKSVDVIEILVKPGDSGRAGAVAGHARVRQGDDGDPVAVRRHREELMVKIGDKVSEGSPILLLDAVEAKAPAPPAAAKAPPAPRPVRAGRGPVRDRGDPQRS